MKRTRYISLIIALLSVLGITAQQQQSQYALYNYRNDGDFNAWLNIDVDSITYSNIGLDSIEYDNFVTQEVWTPDSCYRIPLEVIDSIGFRAPEPVMASNIFYIRDYHAPFTTSIDGLTLEFANTIHRDSIPSVGQVVLSATEMTPYEEGFAGKVIDVQYGSDNVTVVCEEVSVGDIYKRLVLVGKVTNDIESTPSQIRRSKGSWSDPWVNIEDFGVIPMNLDPIEFPIGDLLKIKSPTPKLTCTYSLYISELWYEGEVKVDLYHPDLTYTLTFTLDQLSKYAEFGKLFATVFSDDESLTEWLEEYKNSKIDKYLKEEEEYDKELSKQWFERTKLKIPIPTPVSGVINLELELSPIVKAKGKLELDTEFKTDARQSMSMKWKGFTPAKILTLGKGLPDIPLVSVSAHQDPFKSAKVDLKVKGTLTLGFKTLLNVNLIHKDLIYLGLACDFAKEAGLTLDVTLMDTEQPEMNLYDRLKDSNIKVSTYAKGYAEAGLTPYKFLSATSPKMKLFTREKVYNIFPHFTEPVLPKYNNGHWEGKQPLSFFSYPSKDIYLPCKIGMRIEDEEGKAVKEYQDTYQYLDEIDWQYKYVNMDVSSLPTGSYKCYPTISFFGLTPFNAGPHHNFYVPLPMVASPAELTLAVGSTAEVQFFGGWDTFATVMEEGEDVASIVQDGDPRRITVLGKKEGNASLKIEDRRTTQVVHVPITVSNDGPIGDHEWVDLGLPSGTLWATCNVGANSPEEYGDYFAWGEVMPKNEYSWSTYKYCNGSQYTLTKYCTDSYWGFTDDLMELLPEDDAATANWGSGWQMPSIDQIKELINSEYTTTEWTQQSGVSGILVIGPNENTLFLPAAGDCGSTGLFGAGSHGFYWSRSLFTNYSDSAPELYFWSDPLYLGRMDYKGRDCGLSVRPVRVQKKEETHEYVDLGLPSGTLWATCNIGANSPEEYGDYFAWGEVTPKDDYGWSTYKYCNGSYNTMTKYCTNSVCGYNGFTDGLTELLPEDDAATANWGSPWHMPTREQMEELYNNCSGEWTTQGGVYGTLVTGRNGGQIFLPASGVHCEDVFKSSGSGYWSSSLNSSNSSGADFLYFRSGYWPWYIGYRCCGYSVRAVRP